MTEMGYWQSGLTSGFEVANYRFFRPKTGFDPKSVL
jgi:hypothetical protein